jgi:hypothetical protein
MLNEDFVAGCSLKIKLLVCHSLQRSVILFTRVQNPEECDATGDE